MRAGGPTGDYAARMWSDRETEDDCLGFTQYVPSLAGVCLENGIAPLTMGIFGSWGSGKTSLMKMLQKAVAPTEASDVKTVWFNAWRFEGKDEIQSALINAILMKVRGKQTLQGDIKETFARLREGASVLKLATCIGKSALTLTPDIKGFIEAFSLESEKVVETMATFEADFEKLLVDLKVRRVVVFVDDLDRCQSAKIIETFETIKLFLNIPECTFVLGADDTKIRQAISETYRVGEQTDANFSDDYLEKIIQLPFRIPEQRLDDIRCYVSMLFLRRQLKIDGWNTLLGDRSKLLGGVRRGEKVFATWVAEHTDSFTGSVKEAGQQLAGIEPYIEIVARGLRGNPRQIKRFLNILSLRQNLAADNKLRVDSETLIKLLVIEYTWRAFFKDLVEMTDPTTGRSALLEEFLKCAKSGSPPTDSPALKLALETPGLRDFLLAAPVVEATTDLSPYLFLSQTALSGDRQAQSLMSPDETARGLAQRIASDDRLRSKAAVLQSRKQDPVIIESVVRQLRGSLISATDPRQQVHVLSGLMELCRERPSNYPAVIETLAQLDPASNQAIALPACALLDHAASLSVAGAVSAKARFAAATPLAAAVRRPARTSSQ